MADYFIDVVVETDAQTLADAAIERLKTQWTNWQPSEGGADLEVIEIEAIAPMAQNAAEVFSRVPLAIFRNFGTKLHNIPFSPGAPAVGVVSIAFEAAVALELAAGFEIDVDGFAFRIESAQSAAAGTSPLNGVTIVATENGVAWNDLPGSNIVPISAVSGIISITLTTPPTGGTEPDTDITYVTDLSRNLEIKGDTLVTLRDFEFRALKEPEVGRAVAIHNGARDISVIIAGLDGLPNSTLVKDRLTAVYTSDRVVQTLFNVDDPDYSAISVLYQVKAYPGYDLVDLKVRIDAALATFFSPATWGAPAVQGETSLATRTFYNEPVVFRNKVEAAIAAVTGVNVVLSAVLSGTNGTVSGVNQKDNLDFAGTVSGGTYTLTVDGQTTTAIAYNATPATVRAALEVLTTVEPGDVKVTGGPGPVDMLVEHTGRYAARARTFTRTSSVTGGGTLTVTVNTAVTQGSGDFTMTGLVPITTLGTLDGYVL